MVLKIEHNRNKIKPPAEIMGFERKRRAGEGQAFGGARKRVYGPDPVPHWGLMPESAESCVLMSFAFNNLRHQIPKE
jgi:hypothetical protein